MSLDAVIIGKDDYSTRELEESISKYTPRFRIHKKTSSDPFHRPINEAQLYFIQESRKDNILEFSKRISALNPYAKKILVAPTSLPMGAWEYLQLMNRKVVDATLGFHDKETVKGQIDSFFKEGDMRQKINVGICGAGKFGFETVELLRYEDWCRNVSIYGKSLRERLKGQGGVDSISRLLNEDSSKVSLLWDLDEFFSKDLDVLLVAPGIFGLDYSKHGSRLDKNLVESAFYGTIDNTLSILEARNKSKNKDVLTFHLGGGVKIEPCIYIDHKYFGTDPSKLSGGGADSPRAARNMKEYLENICAGSEDIFLPCVGPHGDVHALLDESYVTFQDSRGRKSLKLIYQEALDLAVKTKDTEAEERIRQVYEGSEQEFRPEFSEKFDKEVNSVGLGVMQSAQETGHRYRGTSNALVKILKSFSDFFSCSPFPIYCDYPEQEYGGVGFTMLPTEIDAVNFKIGRLPQKKYLNNEIVRRNIQEARQITERLIDNLPDLAKNRLKKASS